MNILKLNEPEPAEAAPKPNNETLPPAQPENGNDSELHMRLDISDIGKRLAAAGAISPKLLLTASPLIFGAAGNAAPATAEEAVAYLMAEYPEQFAQRHKPGNIDATAGRDQSGILTPEMLSAMTTKEIRRLDWDAVKRALGR